MGGRTDRTTILVVEDEILILIDLAMNLRSAGFDVLEAPNADIALDRLERHSEIRAVVSGHQTIPESDLPHGARFVAKPADPIRLSSALVEMGVAA